MPSPIARREQIFAALTGVLQAALPGVTIERNRRSVPTADEAPHIAIFDGDHTASAIESGLTSYEIQIGVEATVTAASDAALGPALNDLYARALSGAMVDPTLGGLLTQLAEASLNVRLLTVQESAEPLACFALNLTAEFITADGDPFTA